ncbi:MAG: phosphoglycerate mutase (2,3-diphosphoglycerate-independent) [Parcubacteria group bacterium CG23_combo_of_CG06-09_8_20_14_all_35_9]|nr:MAG: phosphoglycerate mutase (2,3-diphosphoglycerate-independent) [Parcubacteria group bacterium CG23_combo_of_CG06-09_8_20_14_all_35_9]
MSNIPFVLIILDGWGLAPPNRGNAVTLAKTPGMNSLWEKYPHSTLVAYGEKVGLPDGQDGNSEAGHMNLGAGRIVKQDSVYIAEDIKDRTFFKNTAFREAIKHLRKYKTKLHLMGLLSGNQSAHMSPEHLYALLELAKREGLDPVILHLFTDGRDSSQHAAINLLKKLEASFKNKEKIATISGRFYAMDRKKVWRRIEKVYNAMVLGEGERAKSAEGAIVRAYNRGQTDEFIPPTVIERNGKLNGLIQDNDIIFFFNLRSDRARELTKTFVQEHFSELNPGAFERKKMPKNIRFVAMTDFGPDLPHVLTAFPGRDVEKSLPMVLKGFRQLYIAESEKYAHITYFFNGGYADPVAGEKRIRIVSPNVDHYDDTPEMSAYEITETVLKKIKQKAFDFIAVNFANPDMIGHTGNLKAGIKAVEVVDECIGKIVKEVLRKKGTAIVTADHGNAEEMINLETGEVDTKHSTNPVPFIVINQKLKIKKQKLKKGILSDVAPTILKIMNLPQPPEMTGKSLI